MPNQRIKYICYYDSLDPHHPRNCVPAATTKIDYIITALNRVGYDVDIISFAGISDSGFNFSLGGCRHLHGHNTLRHFVSFGCTKTGILRVLSRWLLTLHFIYWFLTHVRKGETIIVYHSLGYCSLLLRLQSLTRCNIIGEIEEIYQDVHPQKKSLARDEYRFFERCDKYIFPTPLLDAKLNTRHRSSLIIHGLYQVEPDLNQHFDDNLIHVIYAGTLDPRKGGSAAAATLLPKKFHLHICGFGNEKDTQELQAVITRTVARGGNVTFDGMLRGMDFKRFLQRCHIGLSTQDPSAAFNNTSFPSKILTYLANGLKVVTIDIPAIRTSAVGNALFYYDEQTPEAIATAILHAAESLPVDGRALLQKLDGEFCQQLKVFL